MRVLLVSANRERIPDPIFPLGLAYVAAAAIAAGHEVVVADLCFARHPFRHLRTRVAAFAPDVVGVSIRNVDNAAYPLTVDYLESHRRVVKTIRAVTAAPVVLGGSAFSILPHAYLQALGGDWGIAGEGEETFVALLAALAAGREPSALPGVVAPGVGLSAPPVHELSRPRAWWDGPRPARTRFDYRRYVRRGGTGNLQTKRGCVFRCEYCTYPLLEGDRFRPRPAGDVVDEIDGLLRDFGPHPLFFVDSILNSPPGHLEGICEEILRRGRRLRWSCYATPVGLGREQARLMARAGCEGVELGSDAVDDGQLGRLGKSFDGAAVHAANDHCLEAGLRVCHTVIFGAPGESGASVRATCAALRLMHPTAVVAMVGVRLYPGTPITRQLAAAGRLPSGTAGLTPTFFVEPAVAELLPAYLRRQAVETGNWVLPGLVPPLLPASQRLFRALGVAGPLWRLLRSPGIRAASRSKFRRPYTSSGVPTPRRIVP
ncbi:MAG: cobalamin-dependent protein [Nitrospirota bacterium]|jgi:radical SAM superfamily enzyme YgiQ (UPF0313 family)